MLAVHWTPVSNTKTIFKNGITKSKKGLYCFPLTGLKSLDRWWIYFFNQCGARQRKKYNGIVFRLKEEDMPAYFGDWIGATNRDDFKKEITVLKTLGTEYRQTILWRIGEEIAKKSNLDKDIFDYKKRTELYMRLALIEIEQTPKTLSEKMVDNDFMTFALEDYQIVLTKSISSKRILKILPQGDEFGRIIRQKKKYDT
jgi:predicted MPP superfamily phosphohydrolase